MILRLRIPIPSKTPNPKNTLKPQLSPPTVTATTARGAGLLFRRKLIYLQSLNLDPIEAVNKNPNLRSAPLSTIYSVIHCLCSIGLEHSSLRRILDMYPFLLTSDPYSDIYPIIDFLLHTVEIPYPEIRKSIIRCPRLLASDLETLLKPTFNFLTELGFTGSNKLTSQTTVLLVSNVEFTLLPKINYLVELGFEYDEVRNMVLRYPRLLTYSIENNFKPKVEYFLNEMNGDLEELKKFPQYFGFNLEQRVKPRHQILMKHGVSMHLPDMLRVSDRLFQTQVVDLQLQLVKDREDRLKSL